MFGCCAAFDGGTVETDHGVTASEVKVIKQEPAVADKQERAVADHPLSKEVPKKEEEPKREQAAVIAHPPATEDPKKEESKHEPKLQEPLHGQVETFDLVMQKDGALGVSLDVKSYGLTIAKLGEGSFAKQNAKSSKKAQQHDVILKVNGQVGKDAILNELKSCNGQVTFTIARVPLVEINISKNGKPLGAGLAYQSASSSIDIKEIRDGALMDYLASAAAHLQISSGDAIVSVNGTSSSLEKMVEVIMKSSDLNMQVCRFSKLA